ncbi:MAG: citrate synthase [Clostridiales bacterium]|nr:citrate synthase [Clostridiales bacterium]MDY3993339.1 citrate synthase [Evtepia sp.]
MIKNDTGILEEYTGSLSQRIREEYNIDENYYRGDVKRGLRNSDGTGVPIGVTKVGSVQGYMIEDGVRVPVPGQLYYRGIELNEIVEAHRKANTFGFEEVAFLLLMGHLPAKGEMAHFNEIMNQAKKLPDGFTEDMIMKHPSRDIMNKLARSVLSLYSYDDNPDDTSVENLLLQSVRLIGAFPSIVANAYSVKRHYFNGRSLHIHYPKENLSTAENFLRMLRADKSYTEEEAHLLDMMLMVHAEHGGGNNSTFVCRALSSSGTDTYSAIAGAVGSLKGPLHGGANAKVMEMFRYVKENVNPRDDGSIKDYLAKILDGEAGDKSGKIYGLGHAVYTISDPRAVLLKKYAQHMAEVKGYGEDFQLLQKIEELGIPMIQERKKNPTPMCANVDMYSGMVYSMLGIPQDVFTPLFASARIAGWCANRIEEVLTCHRIMRPAYRAVVKHVPYIPVEQRKLPKDFAE